MNDLDLCLQVVSKVKLVAQIHLENGWR